VAEPFKNLLNLDTVDTVAQHLARVHKGFDRAGFVAQAAAGLLGMEMKARAMHMATALVDHLPPRFEHAAALVEAALAPPNVGSELGSLQTDQAHAAGLTGWVMWPLGEWVARQGLAHPERALQTLHALTQRLTAEFAIRPFIEAHPELVFKTLHRWCDDDSPHVRRLVSEGSRPRLPWGQRLKALVADPSPTLPLLHRLQDDPSDYVRRSVANHLNDIAKDHPELVVDWVAQHLVGASPQRQALLRHASRTLVKGGHARLLTLWGVGDAWLGTLRFSLAPKRLKVGDSLLLQLHLASTSAQQQTLMVDYTVHHVLANGGTSPKVFKGWQLVLQGGQTRALAKTHSLKPITTRRYHPGLHRVEVTVNGQVVAQQPFELLL
jgi:3-methyladenine DNA glycosylase AlkC